MQHANGMLATASALETAATVRTGTISAVVVRDVDRARERAKLVDAAVAKGRTSPSPVSS